MNTTPRLASHAGFTLMELMIAVVIIGILSAIALPSYKNSVRNSQKANAESVMLNCAQQMERFYAQGMTYLSPPACAAATAANVATSYAIGFNGTPTATTYVLQAVPTADQSANACKTLCLDNTGAKLAGVATGTATTCAALITTPVSGCW